MRTSFSSEYTIFLSLIVDVRKRAEMTQADVAKALRKPQSFVSKYERGERRIDFAEFVRLCDILETDPVKFLKEFRDRRGDA